MPIILLVVVGGGEGQKRTYFQKFDKREFRHESYQGNSLPNEGILRRNRVRPQPAVLGSPRS